MTFIQAWQETKTIYDDGNFKIIYGWYNHKNLDKTGKGKKELGFYFDNGSDSKFPLYTNLAPLVVPLPIRDMVLSGLFNHLKKDRDKINSAIDFFK